MYRHYWKVILGTVLIAMLAGPIGAETFSHNHLDSQASNYLKLLDQKHYKKAWLTMSDLFQTLNEQAQWQSRQQIIRSAYGSLISRQFLRINYRQSYASSPDSSYVIIQYKSIFQNKADTNETVVLDCRNSSSCSVRDYILR